MQRKKNPLERKEVTVPQIKTTIRLTFLPESILIYNIAPYFTSFELVDMKKVSRWFKAFSDNYLGRSIGQVFYAAHLYIPLEISMDPAKPNLPQKVSNSRLVHFFKFDKNKCPNPLTRLFRTEQDALNYIFGPSAGSGLSEEQKSHAWEEKELSVTPIYKVQLVHPYINYWAASGSSQRTAIKVRDFKESRMGPIDPVFVDMAILLPLSVSLKHKFLGSESLVTLLENADLTESEPEVKPARSTRGFCSIL